MVRFLMTSRSFPARSHALSRRLASVALAMQNSCLSNAVWSGDTSSTWADFNQQFRLGLGMALGGVPHWTNLIP